MKHILIVILIGCLSSSPALGTRDFLFYGPDETCEALSDVVLGATQTWRQHPEMPFTVLEESIEHADVRARLTKELSPRTYQESMVRRQTEADGNLPPVAYTRINGRIQQLTGLGRDGEVALENSYESEVLARLRGIQESLQQARESGAGSRGYSFVGVGEVTNFLQALAQHDASDRYIPDPASIMYPMKVGGSRSETNLQRAGRIDNKIAMYVLPVLILIGARSFSDDTTALAVGEALLLGFYSAATMVQAFKTRLINRRVNTVPASFQFSQRLKSVTDFLNQSGEYRNILDHNGHQVEYVSENHFIMNGLNSPYGVNVDFVFTMIKGEPVLTVFTWTPKNFGAQVRLDQARNRAPSQELQPTSTTDDLTELMYKMKVNQKVIRKYNMDPATTRVKFDLEGNAFYFNAAGKTIAGMTADDVVMYPLLDEDDQADIFVPVGKIEDASSTSEQFFETTDGTQTARDLITDVKNLVEKHHGL